MSNCKTGRPKSTIKISTPTTLHCADALLTEAAAAAPPAAAAAAAAVLEKTNPDTTKRRQQLPRKNGILEADHKGFLKSCSITGPTRPLEQTWVRVLFWNFCLGDYSKRTCATKKPPRTNLQSKHACCTAAAAQRIHAASAMFVVGLGITVTSSGICQWVKLHKSNHRETFPRPLHSGHRCVHVHTQTLQGKRSQRLYTRPILLKY